MQFYQVSQTSLAKSGSSVVEEYIPLWMADGTTVLSQYGSAGGNFLMDGASGAGGTVSGSNTHLFTLNTNWNPSQKYAFEATIYISSGGTAYACLWDMTSNTQVIGSTVSTTSTTATVLRSSQFTLVPNHVYGVTLWGTSSSYSAYESDASLIVFGQ